MQTMSSSVHSTQHQQQQQQQQHSDLGPSVCPSVCPAVHLRQKLAKGWKRIWYDGMWVGDGVIVEELVRSVRGRKNGDAKNMLFGGVCWCSLPQGHSPGGAIAYDWLLCTTAGGAASNNNNNNNKWYNGRLVNRCDFTQRPITSQAHSSIQPCHYYAYSVTWHLITHAYRSANCQSFQTVRGNRIKIQTVVTVVTFTWHRVWIFDKHKQTINDWSDVIWRHYTDVLSRLLAAQLRKPLANGLLSIFSCVIWYATISMQSVRHQLSKYRIQTFNSNRQHRIYQMTVVRYKLQLVTVLKWIYWRNVI